MCSRFKVLWWGWLMEMLSFAVKVQKRVPTFRSAYLKNMILNCIALNETCFNGSHGTSIILDLIIFASNAVCILLNLRFCTFCKEKGKQTWGSLKWRKPILPHLKCYSSIIPHKFNLYHGLNHQLRKKQDSLLQYSERGNRGLIHNFFFLALIHCSDVDVIWYLAKLSLISWKD